MGGPSGFFGRRGRLPVYAWASRIDNCNFALRTVWAGAAEGRTFRFNRYKAAGEQLVAEATALSSTIPAQAYDFVLSSHTLEHCANPLLALEEMGKILRDGGVMAVVLPHRDATFDHRRAVTTLDHLIEDYRSGVGEDDMTHWEEIRALHDLALDPDAGDQEAFERRSARNVEHRCLHHHVFDTRLAIRTIDYAGLEILAAEASLPFNILVLARKPCAGQSHDNSIWLAGAALAQSPFSTDRASGAPS